MPTLDLVRVELKADRIPANIGVSVVEESMHYKIMRIGKSDFLLPGSHNCRPPISRETTA
jgi:hypothetical protein